MSFTVNTNVSAMTVLDNLNTASNSLNRSIERLSTGSQLNSGADNPAGLIISSEFQAQINGLNTAISNSQDGVNYVKTADGALAQVSSLLNTAYGLAVAASNTATITSSQQQADNLQLQSIISSVNTIAATTQYGSKYLLNGAAGTTASISNASVVSNVNIGGEFGSSATVSGNASLTVSAAATQAVITLGATFTSATSADPNAGSFTINGVQFTSTAQDNATTLVSKINAAAATTGVTAAYNAASKAIVLTSSGYGTASTIDVADANSVVTASGTPNVTAAGTNAAATLTIGSTTVNFTGGIGGTSGLDLTDSNGNTINLTVAGNTTSTSNTVVAQVENQGGIFQIGANAGQTASLSLGNFSASNLGGSAVTGQNLSTIDLLSGTDASTAMQVINAAINQVSTQRGSMGAFQDDVLQSNISTLQSATTNLSTANSDIADTNIASEMTNYTKESIIMQAGEAVLSQAQQAPQAVVKLLQNM